MTDPRIVAIAAAVDAALRKQASPERAEHERRYLRSSLKHHGVPVPTIRRVARSAYRDLPAPVHDSVVALATVLWGKGVHEDRVAAVEILARGRAHLDLADLRLVERFLREARTWALVDGLAVQVVGDVVQRLPEAGQVLDRWVADDDFWLRRSALLALLPTLRTSGADPRRFLGYADRLLAEREFFVRKAIGWVLRDLGRRQPDVVAAWLGPRTDRASGVTVREAVKYLPPADRDRLLGAYRAGTTAARGPAGSR